MIRVIPSAERYHFESDWLSTYWHFSFDHYYDPANLNFGPLRVFNDDAIRPGAGFPEHAHREMEILTYVVAGRLEHRDDQDNHGAIGPGEVQRMSAGTGIRHSEFNASKTEPVHLLQFWIEPAVRGLKPSWEQKRFTREERRGRLLAVAAGNPRHDTLRLHQDATVYIARLEAEQGVAHKLAAERRAYLFVIDGALSLNGSSLAAGDQARVTDETRLEMKATHATEIILLDLP